MTRKKRKPQLLFFTGPRISMAITESAHLAGKTVKGTRVLCCDRIVRGMWAIARRDNTVWCHLPPPAYCAYICLQMIIHGNAGNCTFIGEREKTDAKRL